MEELRIIEPSAVLAPHVKHYWFLKTGSSSRSCMRTVPTGHICIMFHRGERIFCRTDKAFQPAAFISGHEKKFSDLVYTGCIDMTCIVFRPVGAAAFFRVPMREINGICAEISDFGDPLLKDLNKAIEDSPSIDESVKLIEGFLTRRLASTNYNLQRIAKAIDIINRGETGAVRLANESCLSPRHFNRLFTEIIGAKPKEFQRTVRFQRALYMMQTSPEIPLAQLAACCGYYDQPHLIKEFKALSGYTPLQYTSVCRPYFDYFS